MQDKKNNSNNGKLSFLPYDTLVSNRPQSPTGEPADIYMQGNKSKGLHFENSPQSAFNNPFDSGGGFKTIAGERGTGVSDDSTANRSQFGGFSLMARKKLREQASNQGAKRRSFMARRIGK